MLASALFFFLGFCAPLRAAPPERAPVLLELFTSEGCSSCPPADQLLAALEKDQPIPGVEIIPLAWHVDYWDRLGWKDRFSKADYSQRQRDYQTLKGWAQVYTPQALIQGGTHCNGADWPRVQAQVQALSPSAALRLDLDLSSAKKGLVRVRVRGASAARPLELALTEDGLESAVSGGENQGTVLRHQAVVRAKY